MTEGEAPTVDQSGPLCSRPPPHPLGNRYHVGWEPAGPVCDDCWLKDADEMENARWEEAKRQLMNDRENDWKDA